MTQRSGYIGACLRASQLGLRVRFNSDKTIDAILPKENQPKELMEILFTPQWDGIKLLYLTRIHNFIVWLDCELLVRRLKDQLAVVL